MHWAFGLALFLLQSNATLKGEVRLNGKHPVDQPVRVELFRRGERVADQYTAGNGYFRIDGVEPGPYLLVARCPGYDETSVPLDVLGTSGDTDIVVQLRNEHGASSTTSVTVSAKAGIPSQKSRLSGLRRTLTRILHSLVPTKSSLEGLSQP